MVATDVIEVTQGRMGYWTKIARDGVLVEISWKTDVSGYAVSSTISGGNQNESHHIELGFQSPLSRSASVELSSIEVTLILQNEGDKAELICNLPLTYNEFFNGPIGEWYLEQEEEADSDDYIPVIEAPHNSTDLLPFIWLHPPTSNEIKDGVLRFVRLTDPTSLTLYNDLEQSDTTEAKKKTATTFRSGSSFVKDVKDLDPPANQLPQIRHKLIANLNGQQSQEDIEACVEGLLGESVDSFLTSATWTTAEANIWQSLFVLTLVGGQSDQQLSEQLVDSLRIAHFLKLLNGKLVSLEYQLQRNLALNSTISIPDAVATDELGQQHKSKAGTWELLGVGTLKRARQQLKGYLPGELAEVVNVMPCERQESQETRVTHEDESAVLGGEHHYEQDNRQHTSANSELTEALHEVMAADAGARNMSNVVPSYKNLNQMLSGSWSAGDADTGWSGRDNSRLVQTITEKAARHLGEKVTSQRSKVWKELCERKQSNRIDNTARQRLVGIYRWIDKSVQIDLDDLGRRLILAITVDEPAKDWVDSLLNAPELPLVKPAKLEASDINSYKDIKSSNYQAAAAQYGICDPEAPPADTETVVVTINRIVVGDLSLLVIPKGYRGDAGQVTTAMADSQYNLVCSIAGQDIIYSEDVTKANKLTVIAPKTSSATSVGDAEVTPATVPTAVLKTVDLTKIKDFQGTVPVTVMSSAPLLCVTIEVSCKRGISDTDDPLLVEWQIKTYDRLLTAYREAIRKYNEAVAERIKFASTGRHIEIQRDILIQKSLDILAPQPGSYEPFESLGSWQDMSWTYESRLLNVSDPNLDGVASTNLARQCQLDPDCVFKRFLSTPAADLLLPVQPGCETSLLFDLQFPAPWVGDRSRTPVTESTLLIIEEILGPEFKGECSGKAEILPLDKTEFWSVRLPTSMLYLQQGPMLPQSVTSSCVPVELDIAEPNKEEK
ncbi:hypothetical protein ACMXYN_07675 [Neptuniibacter sp. PT8_73]|uniref:hypothetical protein n=1 Tax=Neptuniibacter sp. PT8_73 TaxID=3398206 RepID=UPI0039F6150A